MNNTCNKIAKTLNPLLTATLVDKIFFWWMTDLFVYGSKNDLEEKDLYSVLGEDQSVTLKKQLQAAWSQEYASALEKKKQPSLWKCLIAIFKWKFIFWSGICWTFTILQLIQPLLLEQIVLYFQSSSRISTAYACLLVTLCILLLTTITILLRTAFFYLMRLGLNIRICCSSLIFNKLLRLSSLDKKTSISVINLLSTDVSKFEVMICYLPFLFTVPLQVVLVIYFIYQRANITTAIVGCISLILQSLPAQAIYYKCITKLRAKQAVSTDKRISLISEVISGIRAVKMYVWEKYFAKLVYSARRYEIDVFFKISYFKSIIASCMHSAQRVSIFLVVATYTLQNELMSVDKLISIAQYLSILKESAMGIINLTVRYLVDGNNSVKRIENFLLREEFISTDKVISSESTESLTMKKVAASWDSTKMGIRFSDINLEIERRQLCVIIGSVGAGKTTLLKVILGELPLMSGDLDVNGQISYASQEPWLFNGSIKDNIIFGGTYCEKKYKRVVSACALLEDFISLPYGDKTFVGEKGASLSGGQCARINLARAVYKDADIYLLDDPLSAVDTRVAKILLEDCINDLLRDKTRILVTHNIQFLPKADQIVMLNKGSIQFQGTFSKFQSTEYYSIYSFTLEKNTCTPVSSNGFSIDSSNLALNPAEKENTDNEPEEMEELIVKGGISNFLFFKYIQFSKSYLSIIILIFSGVALMLLCAGFDYWIVTWVQDKKFYDKNNYQNYFTSNTATSEGIFNFQAFLYISTSLLIGMVFFSTIKIVYFYKFSLKASQNIHNSMFECLVGAPLKFFQTNPTGRILNRFSEDTISVDDFLSQTMVDTLFDFIILCALFVPVLIISGWHVFTVLIYIFVCCKLYKLCVPIIRSTKRLAGLAISPILSFANSSFAGVTTIRSQKAEKFVDNNFDTLLDQFTAAHLLHIAATAAMRTWIDLLVPILFGIVAYSSFLLKSDDKTAGYIGLSIMQILNLSRMTSFFIKTLSDVLSYTVNLERMLEFTELEQEGSYKDEPYMNPPHDWPTAGELILNHLYLRYSNDGSPVLQDINLTIRPGMKVGIVGRTGAGKSSLISALFRIVSIDGTIFIDGIDTQKISLPNLRRKISIIPQEPIIFNSSLRSNLDPFNEYEDAILWSALHRVQLRHLFSSLDYPIEKAGQNVSLGQRQLLCLARAIIKNNKILVLDEATANVDHITDALIQKTIKDQFKNCTVLTIAHRLNTVIDNDRIIVMSNGKVVEYDHPHLLLKKNEGYFISMVQQMGASTLQHFKKIAEQAYWNEKES